ncbi:MAG: cupin domain-containing protein [Acidimicrobiia bacterium]|nr:cupin domain-containing protein [Acidimicrobiia bacterium]
MPRAESVEVIAAGASASVRHLADQTEFRSTCGFRRDLTLSVPGEPLWFHYLRIRDARRHSHRRTTEYYFVVDGEGHIELDDDRVAIAKGDLVVIPPGTRHDAIPEEGRELHVLIIAVPDPEDERPDEDYYD